MANGYSSDSTQRELPNEYQHDRVRMIFIIICFFVHMKKVTSAAEGLILHKCSTHPHWETESISSALHPFMPGASLDQQVSSGSMKHLKITFK